MNETKVTMNDCCDSHYWGGA